MLMDFIARIRKVMAPDCEPCSKLFWEKKINFNIEAAPAHIEANCQYSRPIRKIIIMSMHGYSHEHIKKRHVRRQ